MSVFVTTEALSPGHDLSGSDLHGAQIIGFAPPLTEQARHEGELRVKVLDTPFGLCPAPVHETQWPWRIWGALRWLRHVGIDIPRPFSLVDVPVQIEEYFYGVLELRAPGNSRAGWLIIAEDARRAALIPGFEPCKALLLREMRMSA